MKTKDKLQLVLAVAELAEAMKSPSALKDAAKQAAAGLALIEAEEAKREECAKIINEGHITLQKLELQRHDLEEVRRCAAKETQEAEARLTTVSEEAAAKSAEADAKMKKADERHAMADIRHSGLDVRERAVEAAAAAAEQRHKEADTIHEELVKASAHIEHEKARLAAHIASINAALESAQKGK